MLKNIDSGYLLEPPRHNLCFEQKYEKYQNFYLKIFIFGGQIFSIFELACFRNEPVGLGLTICLWLGPPWFNYWFSFTLANSKISHEYSSLFIIVINLIFMFSL